MEPKDILDKLLYLDRDFIATAYEAIKGEAPATEIIKAEGKNAGVSIPVFNAGVSAQESKKFSSSTFGMLASLASNLKSYPNLSATPLKASKQSTTAWISGKLTISKTTVRESSKSHSEHKRSSTVVWHDPIKSSETYFSIKNIDDTVKLALITTPDYFSSGVSSLLRLSETVVDHFSIPVRSLVRVYGAKSSFSEWIAVPLIIIERDTDA